MMTDAEQRTRERLLASLAEPADIVFVKDLAGRYLMVNEAAAAVIGRTPDEMVGKLDVDVLPPKVAAEQREYDALVFRRGEPITFEGPVVAGRELHTFRTTKAPLQDAEGNIVGVIGVSIDVSARQIADEALRRSEAQLAEAQELTSVGSWQWELAGERRTWSEQLFRIFAMDPSEEPLSWDQFLELVHPEDRPKLAAAFGEALQTGSHFSITHRLRRRDGEQRLFACSARIELDLDGSPVRAIGACQDVTEQQQEQERRREQEAQLNAAQKLTGVGSWEWDMETDSVTWSENLYVIFGIDHERFGGTYAAYLEAVHPEDREVRRVAIERVVATGQTDRSEHRIVRPDGEVRLLESTASLVEDATGHKRLIGACQDVTDLRRSERELEQQALRDPLTSLGNRTLAFDRLAHAVHVASRRGSTVAVLYLDIDGFKQLNDELGHAAGDEALRELARRLEEAVRDSDTVARIGGDEFLVVCEDLQDLEAGEQIARRVRACFDEEFEVEGQRRQLAGSVGLAFAGDSTTSVDELVGDADAAMYRDKSRQDPPGR